MALGLAPIVVDYGGPSELVTADTGFSVPLGRRHEIVDALGATLERLATDPAAVARAGAAARARVEALFTWDRKAEQIARVYDWVLRDRAAERSRGHTAHPLSLPQPAF
jgi:glycosyltransferase involved in cell wall biosynthesis